MDVKSFTSNKINCGNYSLKDFIIIMDILECDIQIITRDIKNIQLKLILK